MMFEPSPRAHSSPPSWAKPSDYSDGHSPCQVTGTRPFHLGPSGVRRGDGSRLLRGSHPCRSDTYRGNLGFLTNDKRIAVFFKPGAGWNQPSHDDVFLQTQQIVLASVDG